MNSTPATAEYVSTRARSPWEIGNIVKRAFDWLAAAAGLLLLSPLFGVIALLIKRDSPGPVFYRGRRAAMGGGTFRILKFRTMYENPESYAGPKVTAGGDPRITPLGRWLRDTKVNELPQLWNVLKGEMSLVGPRPEDPEIAAQWPPEVRAEILSVRPGITSPASVLYRDEEHLLKNGDDTMDTYLYAIAPDKQRLDQLYVRHRSFWLDLDVLLWTFLVLIPHIRNYQPPENLLYRGPITLFIRRYLNWFAVDALTTFFAFAVVGVIWRSVIPLQVGWGKSAVLVLGFALVFSLVNALLGVNRIEWSRARASDVLDLLPAVGVASALTCGINWWLGKLPAQSAFSQAIREALRSRGGVWGDGVFPSRLILLAALLATIGFVTIRYRSRLITGVLSRIVHSRSRVRAASERVLIVGGGQAGQFAIRLLNSGKYASLFHPVGIVDDDIYKQGARIRGVEVIGQSKDIPRLVKARDIGIIVFAIHNISAAERRSLLEICRQTRSQVVVLPDFLESVEMAHAINGNGGKVDAGLHQAAGWLPDHIPAAQVEIWLQGIGELAEANDLDAVQRYLERVRDTLPPRKDEH